jgi:hypothetical protein
MQMADSHLILVLKSDIRFKHFKEKLHQAPHSWGFLFMI